MHERLGWTPRHEMILGRCQREDWSESLGDNALAAQYDGLALGRDHDLARETRHVGQRPEDRPYPAVPAGVGR